ncbi:MAG: hypothetical protein D6722_02555 [Bacteroidetes bacterium]|nr:MAG: hypothetical protein D6722_02555 [Bacteroidota bacterium]
MTSGLWEIRSVRFMNTFLLRYGSPYFGYSSEARAPYDYDAAVLAAIGLWLLSAFAKLAAVWGKGVSSGIFVTPKLRASAKF